ncbi:MAG: recombinase zinc beta ribbon domain-containing protein [Actinomycetota bacterium]
MLARREIPSLRRSNLSDYLLTGLVVCDRCGKKLVGAAATGRNGRYPYSVCFSRQRYGNQECDQDRLRADELEERVLDSLLSTLDRPELLLQAGAHCLAALSPSRPKLEKELAAITGKIRKAEEALDRYFRAFETGALHEAQCTARIKNLGVELASLEDRRRELVEEMERKSRSWSSHRRFRPSAARSSGLSGTAPCRSGRPFCRAWSWKCGSRTALASRRSSARRFFDHLPVRCPRRVSNP